MRNIRAEFAGGGGAYEAMAEIRPLCARVSAREEYGGSYGERELREDYGAYSGAAPGMFDWGATFGHIPPILNHNGYDRTYLGVTLDITVAEENYDLIKNTLQAYGALYIV